MNQLRLPILLDDVLRGKSVGRRGRRPEGRGQRSEGGFFLCLLVLLVVNYRLFFCPVFYRKNWTFVRARLGSVSDENH